MRAILLVASLLSAACASPGFGIAIEGTRRVVEAEDGFPLVTYRLTERGRRAEAPRALLFYAGGSEPSSALDATERLAGAAAMGVPVVMLEPRGVDGERQRDLETFHRFATKERRARDLGLVLDAYLRDAPKDLPCVLLGVSEGGDVAARVAAGEPRVTHLILVGSGGGWCQEQELRHLLRTRGPMLGLEDERAFDSRLALIRADPGSLAMWAGHPHRRWSSYLWDAPVGDMLRVNRPILLAHGGKDESVPVESARAARDAFEDAGRSNLAYVEIEGADHGLRDAATGQSLFPRLEIEIVAWLARQGLLDEEEAERYEARVRRSHRDLFGEPASAPTARTGRGP